MSDRSFLRFGGLAGVLLAITSWAAVVAYYVLVPAAQRAPLSGTRDVGAYLASLPGDTTGLAIFNGLFLLAAVLTNPDWAKVGHAAATFALAAVLERVGPAPEFGVVPDGLGDG